MRRMRWRHKLKNPSGRRKSCTFRDDQVHCAEGTGSFRCVCGEDVQIQEIYAVGIPHEFNPFDEIIDDRQQADIILGSEQ